MKTLGYKGRQVPISNILFEIILRAIVKRVIVSGEWKIFFFF